MRGFIRGFRRTTSAVHQSFVRRITSRRQRKSTSYLSQGRSWYSPVYPQVKWLKEHGVDADVIMGFRNKDILFFEDEMKAVAKNLYVCTDDGSYGFHGNGSQQLQALVDARQYI